MARRCAPPERARSPELAFCGHRAAPSGSARVAACLPNAMSCSSRSTSGVGIACQPWAIRSSRPRHSTHWPDEACCSPTIGPMPRRAVPSRACLYTGTYQHQNRSLLNGTPLDARFTNVALIARAMGYDPVLFGYTDTSVDPRTVPAGDPRLFTYEGVLPGFDAVVLDPWEQGSPAWGRWLAAHGVDVPANPHDLYEPLEGYPGSDSHGTTWAPARFPAELSQTVFIRQAVMEWLEQNGDQPVLRPCLVHPAAPATPESCRLSRPLPGGRRRPVHRLVESRGGGLDPSAGRARPGAALGRRPEGRARAPSVTGHVLRRAARGGRRAGPAALVPRRERTRRIDDGRADERPRGDGRRPLAGREARLLGRELPRAAHRRRPDVRGRRRSRPYRSTP